MFIDNHKRLYQRKPIKNYGKKSFLNDYFKNKYILGFIFFIKRLFISDFYIFLLLKYLLIVMC